MRANGLPPAIELSAFRVVQEALTNVRRHAGRPVHAHVRVQRDERGLTIEVADDGNGRPVGDPDGHGLLGMRERANLFGGDFSAGPGESGGFVVRASFPLTITRRLIAELAARPEQSDGRPLELESCQPASST